MTLSRAARGWFPGRADPFGAAVVGLLLTVPATLLAPSNARAADPVSYIATLQPTDNAPLDAALKASSNLIALRDSSSASPFSLILRAEQDVERFQTALRSFGFYRATVTIHIAHEALDAPGLADDLTRAPADPAIPVDIAIDTGPRFTIGSVALQGPIPLDIAADVSLAPGAPAIAADILNARDTLLAKLRGAGYALAKVEMPPATLHPDSKTLDVALVAEPGPLTKIGRITFTGLGKVHEDFVRRRLTLHPGDRFNPKAIEAARADLAGLGVFSAVRVEPADRLDPDGRLPVAFAMTERPRHAVTADASYSTDLGVTVGGGWQHRNLFGNAEQLNVAGSLQPGGNATSKPGYMASVTFIKPDFLMRDQSLTLGVAAIKRSLRAYDQDALTQKAILTRALAPHWSVSFGLTGEQERIYQEGTTQNYNLIGAPLQVKYDSSNNLFDPTSGIKAAALATPTYALGGASALFVTAQLSASAYIDLSGNGRSVLAMRGLAGEIFGVANAFGVPPDQRFYAGGSATVRGYRYQSIGPRFASGDPKGGTGVSATSIEFRQRIGEKYGFAAFVDAGQTSGRGAPFTSAWHAGAGVGARYYTSIGPIRLDVAVPLNRAPGDDSFEIYIGIGQAF